MELNLKEPFERFADGRCTNCYRKQCNCGKVCDFLACSLHINNSMRIRAIPIVQFRAAPNPTHPKVQEIVGYADVAECEVFGCDTVRAIKTGQDVPRNQNRKTGRKNKS